MPGARTPGPEDAPGPVPIELCEAARQRPGSEPECQVCDSRPGGRPGPRPPSSFAKQRVGAPAQSRSVRCANSRPGGRPGPGPHRAWRRSASAPRLRAGVPGARTPGPEDAPGPVPIELCEEARQRPGSEPECQVRELPARRIPRPPDQLPQQCRPLTRREDAGEGVGEPSAPGPVGPRPQSLGVAGCGRCRPGRAIPAKSATPSGQIARPTRPAGPAASAAP